MKKILHKKYLIRVTAVNLPKMLYKIILQLNMRLFVLNLLVHLKEFPKGTWIRGMCVTVGISVFVSKCSSSILKSFSSSIIMLCNIMQAVIIYFIVPTSQNRDVPRIIENRDCNTPNALSTSFLTDSCAFANFFFYYLKVLK